MTWTRVVLLSLEWAWLGAGCLCLAFGAGLALRARLVERVERSLRDARRADRVALALFAAFLGALTASRLAQLARFELMGDTGVMNNLAWNAAHGYGLWSSVYGDQSYLSVHFAFTLALLSPLLRVWGGPATLPVVQAIVVASSVPCVYLMAKARSRDPLAPWLVALLAMSGPFFKGMAWDVLDNSLFALPLFLWSAYFWMKGRRAAAAALGLLLLTTREQVPFTLFGLGLYALASGRRWRPHALALLLGAPALWLAEMAVVHRAHAAAAPVIDYWRLFDGLGGSRAAIVETAARRPWAVAGALVWPPAKLIAPLRLLFYTAFLGLASGAAILPAAITWLPQQLAQVGTGFHDLNAHASAFVYGPLVWAGVLGLGRLLERADASRRRAVLAGAFGICGFGFLAWSEFLSPPQVPPAWERTAPKALTAIGPDDKVWCVEHLLPQLGLRRYVKVLPGGLPDPMFEQGLFLPDRVVFSTYWAGGADPRVVRRLFDFLKSRGFGVVFKEDDLVVLGSPARTAGVERVSIP